MIKLFASILLLVSLGEVSIAQTGKIGEWKQELALYSPGDTSSLELLSKLSKAYHSLNVDSSLHYARVGQALSSAAGVARYDFLWANLTGGGYLLKGMNDSALFFMDRAISIAREEGVDSLYAIASTNKAMALQGKYQMPEALEILLEVIELGRENGDMPRILSNALNSTGIIFNRVGANYEAVKFYSESLEIANQRKDTLLEGYLYSNIGRIFFEQKDYAKAIFHSKFIYQKYKNDYPSMGGLALGNLGACYSGLGNLDSASKYIWESHTFAQERNSSAELATSYYNLASLELLRGDSLNSLTYLDTSLSVAPAFYHKYKVLYLKGKTLAQLGQDDSAVVYLGKAVEAAREAQSKNSEARMSKELSDQYIKMGAVEKGYAALRASVVIEDSLRKVNDGLQEVLADFREQKEKTRLRREIDLTQDLNEQLENKWALARWAIGISLAFAVVLVLFIRARFQLANALIKKKASELSQEKKRLFWRSESLRYSTAHNQVNHHSLFFSIGKIKSLLDSKGEEELSDELEKHLGHIRKVIDVCRQEESNLQEELSIAAGLVDIYKHRGFKFELRNDSAEDLSNIAFPTLGLLPLIENAVQHSSAAEGAEKVIATSIRSSPSRITIDIKNPAKNTPVSTSGHKSVGLENCRERISIWTQQYEDECTLDLKVKEGRAEVSLDIPIIHFDE